MQGTQVRALVGKIPHVMGNKSPWAATTEACVPRAYALQPKKPPQWEVCALQERVAPPHWDKKKPSSSKEDLEQPEK